MNLWIEKDALENLKQKITSPEGGNFKLVDTMKASGMAATPYLSECFLKNRLLLKESSYILDAIKKGVR